MHPSFVSNELSQFIYFLDPGILPNDNTYRYWRPSNLPMDEALATKYLKECFNFGNQFKEPSELVYYAAFNINDFYSHTSMAIKSELADWSENNHESPDSMGEQENYIKAQMILLLAWSLEETILELLELEQGLQHKWELFYNSVGFSEQEKKYNSYPINKITTIFGLQKDSILSWKKLLPWFLLYLPDDAYLFVTEKDIGKEWMGNDVLFNPVQAEGSIVKDFGLEEQVARVRQIKVPGWKLILENGPIQDKPWMNKEYQVLYCDQSKNENSAY